MEFNRTLWKGDFTKDDVPKWKCPDCQNGTLFIDKDTFKCEFDNKSKKLYAEDYAEIEMLSLKFKSDLVCDDKDCGERVYMMGVGSPEENFYRDPKDPSSTVIEYFQPTAILPAPYIISIPDGISSKLENLLISSFSLFWGDISSCANKIRIFIEYLLDDQGVARHPIDKAGIADLNRMLGLHSRLKRFQTSNSGLADKLMAVKWLGNTASHSGFIDDDDLLDAFELIDFVLDELYVAPQKRLSSEKIASRLTEKHGK